MGEATKIQWCHHTFNPWIGCTKVAPECAHCYAEELMAGRWKKVEWGDKGTRKRTTTWKDPVKWNKAAEAAGERRRVFCASLADVFESKPELVEMRKDLFNLIDATPWLDWLLLTKRPENIKKMWPLPKMEYHDLNIPLEDTAAIERLGRRNNVWLGTSCGHSESVHRVQSLVKCREVSPVLFLSMEPLLTPVDLSPYVPHPENPEPFIDWVIVGGESGPKARPCNIDWIRSIVQQCKAAGVPVFVKQLGAFPVGKFDDNHGAVTGRIHLTDPKGGDPEEWPEDLRVREFPKGAGQ